tara:strand:- start:35 stop:706 length:672 start_codon:yes stop_codon:yes gene_type:complete
MKNLGFKVKTSPLNFGVTADFTDTKNKIRSDGSQSKYGTYKTDAKVKGEYEITDDAKEKAVAKEEYTESSKKNKRNKEIVNASKSDLEKANAKLAAPKENFNSLSKKLEKASTQELPNLSKIKKESLVSKKVEKQGEDWRKERRIIKSQKKADNPNGFLQSDADKSIRMNKRVSRLKGESDGIGILGKIKNTLKKSKNTGDQSQAARFSSNKKRQRLNRLQNR